MVVEPAGGKVIGHRRGYVTGAHDRRPLAERQARESHEPGIGRAVGIDDIGPDRRQRPPHRKNSAQILAADRKSSMRKRAPRRLHKDSGPGDSPDFDRVPARGHALSFFKYADLLTAPTHGGLGVRDSQRSSFQYSLLDLPTAGSATLRLTNTPCAAAAQPIYAANSLEYCRRWSLA